jgi:hypothetical protein
MEVQENQVGLKLNGTYQLLAYTDDMNLLRDNIYTIRKNAETLIHSSNEVGLKIKVEKTKLCCYIVTGMQGKIMI